MNPGRSQRYEMVNGGGNPSRVADSADAVKSPSIQKFFSAAAPLHATHSAQGWWHGAQ